MNTPRLSVIVPTHNRKALVIQLLDSLAQVRQVPGGLEVILVDDGSEDGTREAIKRRRDPFPLRILSHTRPYGPAAARNYGAAEAGGGILGFLDSDVTVHPGWWQAAAPHFDRPQVAAVEGATLPPAGSPPPTPFTHFVQNNRGHSFQTCNFFCRREVFRRLGGFDKRFSWIGYDGKIWHVREDTDLAFSILESGGIIEFENQALAFHPLLPAPREVYFRKVYYGEQEVLLRKKHPSNYRLYLSWIDGRAFPIFYWGVFWGLPFMLIGAAVKLPTLTALAAGTFLMGWAGSVYAVCRKRRTRLGDLLVLAPQFLAIPWLRLYWVLRGEWKYRKVKPKKT